MAKNKPIESNTQELFDSSDPWNNATQDIRGRHGPSEGRINLNKATLGRNDEYLLTNSLLRNNALVDDPSEWLLYQANASRDET